VRGRILTGRRALAGALAGFAVLMIAAPCAAYTPPETDPRIVVTTPQGEILIALAPENAPKHVEQFLIALEAGDFNGANVTRVAPKFYVQLIGGSGTARLAGLPVEHIKVGNLRGALSVYDGGEPGEAPTLMLVLTKSPQLDIDYTAIGFVEAGTSVLREIAESGTIGDQQPAEAITVTEMHVASQRERSALRETENATTPDENGTALLAAVFIVACAAFVAALISAFHDRLGKQRVVSLALLVALLTFFAVWVALGGTKAGSGLIGVALFGGAIAIFRLMGGFERPHQSAELGRVAQPRQFADRELYREPGIDQPDSDLEVGIGDRDTTAGGFGSS
jgi:cyclophilin family peptidyl-prolyl cis-trans isomerase